MALREDIRIELSSEPRLLCSVRGLIAGYLNTHGFSEDRIREVVLAVDEACANSIRHSYGGEKDQRLTLSLCSNSRGTESRLYCAMKGRRRVLSG
ncbi:MAG: ATP-binding protein [Candidatus Hydrogenedentes bacterium]|nr:ATP-binding protein [Candidatus Hydrogenedentota bacterium]